MSSRETRLSGVGGERTEVKWKRHDSSDHQASLVIDFLINDAFPGQHDSIDLHEIKTARVRLLTDREESQLIAFIPKYEVSPSIYVVFDSHRVPEVMGQFDVNDSTLYVYPEWIFNAALTMSFNYEGTYFYAQYDGREYFSYSENE